MDEIKKDLSEIKADISIMKVDLRHHIKRSDKHETWLMTLIVLLAGSVGAGLVQVAPAIASLLK